MTTPPTDAVVLSRDSWGIGHASAPSAELAFWAQGWMAASDRMWQMDTDRRRCLGRWAEIAGPTGVAEDRFFRRLGLGVAAQRDWDVVDPSTKAMTEAYSRGVNDWLGQNSARLPPEYEHHGGPPEAWEPWHCLAVYKVRHLFMGTFHRKVWRSAVTAIAGPEVARAMVEGVGSATPILPLDGEVVDLLKDSIRVLHRAEIELATLPEVEGASNSWAVHGSRTASGMPLLAGDPHRGIEFPNVYYQNHLTCPEFDVIGLSFPGVPAFPHFGHNDEVAWCITHGMADDTDIFIEDGLIDVDRTETIEINGEQAVTVTCSSTPRGPVVLGEPDRDLRVLSMMWTGISNPDTTFACLRPMLSAGSVDELEQAVESWVIPVNSLLTADRAGSISYRLRGRLVERSSPNRWTAVPGDDEHSWAGLEAVVDHDLHRLRNPNAGFLVTANNKVADYGPYVSLDFSGPARHDRIVQLLSELRSADVGDMSMIHADVVSLVAEELVPILAQARPETEIGRQALSQLVSWDHRLDLESVGATIYGGLRRHWSQLVGARLGLSSVAVLERPWPPPRLASRMLFDGALALLRNGAWRLVPGLDSDADLAGELGALVDAVAAELTEHLGPEIGDWTWGKVHIMVSPHPLATARPDLEKLHPPVESAPGDGDTVRVGSTHPLIGDRISSASVARYAFDLADWDRSGWVVPHGVSGIRGSGHDLDQRSAWLDCRLLPMAYSSEAVAAITVETETIQPST